MRMCAASSESSKRPGWVAHSVPQQCMPKKTSRMDVKVAGGRSIADHVMEAYESCCQPQERNEGRKPQGCDEAQNEGSQGDESCYEKPRPRGQAAKGKTGHQRYTRR